MYSYILYNKISIYGKNILKCVFLLPIEFIGNIQSSLHRLRHFKTIIIVNIYDTYT